MSTIPITIAILAIIATLVAAFLQPVATHWLTPKQKLRVDITGSKYEIPPIVSREMSEFGIKLYARGKPNPEFGDFLRNANRYTSYFDISITNSGKTVLRNVVLGCSAYGKYVLIRSRNSTLYQPDQSEYLLGDLQPSETVRCEIWACALLPTYEPLAREMFTVRDDHNSSKKITLKRFYDETSHYLFDRSKVELLTSMMKWTVLPPIVVGLLIYLGLRLYPLL